MARCRMLSITYHSLVADTFKWLRAPGLVSKNLSKILSRKVERSSSDMLVISC